MSTRHIRVDRHTPDTGVGAGPMPANRMRLRNRSGRNARVRIKGYPPGPTPPPTVEIEIPPAGQPPLPNNQDSAAPINPPANLVKYTAEAQYDNDPTWVACSPDLELPESRETITAQLNLNDEIEWQAV